MYLHLDFPSMCFLILSHCSRGCCAFQVQHSVRRFVKTDGSGKFLERKELPMQNHATSILLCLAHELFLCNYSQQYQHLLRAICPLMLNWVLRYCLTINLCLLYVCVSSVIFSVGNWRRTHKWSGGDSLWELGGLWLLTPAEWLT